MKLIEFSSTLKTRNQVIGKDKKHVSQNEISGEKGDLQSILFCTVGVLILVKAIPGLLSWGYQYIYWRHMQTDSVVSFFQSPLVGTFIALSLEVVLSLLLIFKANGLSNLIRRLRTAGTK